MKIALSKAGHQVLGFDLVQSQLDSFKASAGIPAASALEAAKDVEVIITMLPA
ncbi:hypothetical protein FD960_06185 [Polynucleobacter sp. AP-Nino-20-G2]|nr:hypothetical protein FD960_06185 [Polynucleobacter sp. AP-Nino-20-G2]